MKRLWKRLTLRRRAYAAGSELGNGHGWDWGNMWMLRNLVRLNNIVNGIRPFKTTVGRVGDVPVTTLALRTYGNVR